MARESKTSVSIPEFHRMLVLVRWALGIFNEASFENISAMLKASNLEGLNDEDGHTRFYHAVVNTLFYLGDDAKCTKDELAAYDLRIVGYWKQITEKRNQDENTSYQLKYYQWLTLLVTELYLDWYFNRRAELLAELNQQIAIYNEGKATALKLPNAELKDLNKISFWEATGAGKTLLMNVNILQYAFYAQNETPDHVILLTPDEGLTKQHVKELKLSGFEASPISEDLALFQQGGGTIGVIDAGKIISDESKRKKGEKSFMAEEFSGKNLVLVDEGHNGSSSVQGERRKVREQLCDGGFSFEYSATFGQAVAKRSGKDGADLRAHYARNILFDYSYKYFYSDGYGKNAFILNMPDDKDEARVFEYLCGNLLKLVQQHVIFAREAETMSAFNIEKPLLMFVGNTVTGSKEDDTALSDVQTVVKFFADVLNERNRTEKLFSRFLKNEAVLVNQNGFNLLDQAFTPLLKWCEEGKSAYELMLKFVFNSSVHQRLKVTYLNSPDEVVLSVGAAKPFAVIHIGDSAGFIKGLDEVKSLDINPDDAFSDSAFDRVNDKDSSINVLMGSRKFTQGWSCWRVSSIGLLNMGVSEGTQIIQLFGRGVRLKGKGYSLKRSRPSERPQGSFVDRLETINVFGIHADYMAKFREYLNEEGITTEDAVLELDFGVARKRNLPQLEVLEIEDGYRLNQAKGYKSQTATLFLIPEEIRRKIKEPHFEYSDFSYLQSLQTGGERKGAETDQRKDVKLDAKAFPYCDWDGLYRRLLDTKQKKGYWNLQVEKDRLIAFVRQRDDWYTLYSRPDDVRFDSFGKLRKIERLLEILLKGYMERFYKALQSLYENEHLVRVKLDLDRVGVPAEYKFQIENTAEGLTWKNRLEQLRRIIADGKVPAEVSAWNTEDFVALLLDYHLYEPLFYDTRKTKLPFKMRPVMFDSPSEVQFLKDLDAYYHDPSNAAFFSEKDIYLLRNPAVKGRGIGFAQAGNFYPDFLLWMVDKKKDCQYLAFIDPKGLRNIKPNSPKIEFAKGVKELEEQINKGKEKKLVLSSFILSYTKESELPWLPVPERNWFKERNVFFMDVGGPTYLAEMFGRMC